MIDVQNQPDHRNIRIDKVGVKNIRYYRWGNELFNLGQYQDASEEYKKAAAINPS